MGLVRLTTLQFDYLVQNVPQEARQAEVLFKVVLHVVPLLAHENTLDELIEVLILMADQRLDLVGLSVRYDLVFNYFAVGRVREHDWQDGQ